jgi:hypothetical protein
MRRVLLIMPLLVVLVACGGSPTLTAEEITKKMTAKGLCRTEPDVSDRSFDYQNWYCKETPNGEAISIWVYESKESFVNDLRESYPCTGEPAKFGVGGNAWGANWITREVADDGATSAAIARVLGGDYNSYDLTEVCDLTR